MNRRARTLDSPPSGQIPWAQECDHRQPECLHDLELTFNRDGDIFVVLTEGDVAPPGVSGDAGSHLVIN